MVRIILNGCNGAMGKMLANIIAQDEQAQDVYKRQVTIQIGNLNSYNSDYYAKVEGSDDIYTIASSYVSDISNDISALQEKESFPTITSTSITDVPVSYTHL